MSLSLSIFDIIGYVGSLLVVISMLMTSVMKLRIINTAGSILAVIYSIAIHAYPTLVMNIALIIINVINLRKLSKNSTEFRIVKTLGSDAILGDLILKYKKDIKNFFPGYRELSPSDTAFVIFNADVPVGITAGKIKDDCFNIYYDYTIPAYRDCSVGKYLFDHLKSFGPSKAMIADPTEEHIRYIKKIGFSQEGNTYQKTL